MSRDMDEAVCPEVTPKTKLNKFIHSKLIYIILIALICISALAVFVLRNTIFGNGLNNNFKITKEIPSIDGHGIKIISDCSAVLFLDGYLYGSSNGRSMYSRYNSEVNYDEIRGKKLGEVTLDLKGKLYTGIPPSFSSTLDVGTEVYSIKNVKKTKAILIKMNSNYIILYRLTKARDVEKQSPFNLKVSDVFKMMSDSTAISAVELRDARDGSWMRTSEEESLITFINKELPKLELLTVNELGADPYKDGRYISVNLIFKDGSGLDIEVFPEEKCAQMFWGYIRLTDKLCTKFQELSAEGDQYPSISDLLPYKESDIGYLYLLNKKNGDKLLCKTPQLSCSGLYSIFDYYRVNKVDSTFEKKLILTSILGKSKNDNIEVNFYEAADKQIITEINGVLYKPAIGKIAPEELFNYLRNSTVHGFEKVN